VPELDGRAQAEAEDVLTKRGLTPESRPQLASGVEPGRVVPHSQSPVRGLLVRRGTSVSLESRHHPADRLAVDRLVSERPVRYRPPPSSNPGKVQL
jgi:beta-lactam-binding protein with PASTA domain